MTPVARWMLWAAALFALSVLGDIVVLRTGIGAIQARSLHEAAAVVSRMLGAYLLLGLAATGLFWSRGRGRDAGLRLVATIAFLIAQGLLLAFMSLATLLGTPHRRWNELGDLDVAPAPASLRGTTLRRMAAAAGGALQMQHRCPDGRHLRPPSQESDRTPYSCERFTGAAPASAIRQR